jgi:membrane fusion protein (multidrug efflux system)
LKKRLILILTLVAATVLIGWRLVSNKRQMAVETELSTIRRAFVPVEVAQPVVDTLAARMEAEGIFMPGKEMFVISETQGRVVQVYKNKGDLVREGEVIAQIDNELARTELAATEAQIAKLRTDQERLQRLVAGEAVPKSKLEEVNLAIVAAEAKRTVVQKQVRNSRIKATMTGTMGMRFIERGSVIGPGIQVAQITGLDKLLLMVMVTEKDVVKIRKGQAVEVRPDVYTGPPLNGRVVTIGVRADNAFNYPVEIEVANPPGQPMRAGMHAKALFAATTSRQGITIPRKAISGSLQDPRIYVLVQDTLAQLRTVTLGETFGDRVEVVSGLGPTDRVIVSGQSSLSDGARVEIIR